MEFILTFYSETETDKGVYFNTETKEEILIINAQNFTT